MGKGLAEGLERVATLVDLLRLRCDRQGQDLAYEFLAEGEAVTDQCTYGALDARARAIAALLTSLNCAGQPVLLLYPPGLDYVAAFFGCLYGGAIAVPAYPPRPNRSLDRLQVMTQDAGAKVALTHSSVLGGLEKRLGDYGDLKQLHWLATDALDITLGETWQPPTLSRDSLALLQYTSGSTGTPKGVMISHGNLLHNSARINQFFGDTAASRGVSWLPPYHDMGLVGGLLQPLYVGATMVLMPPVAFLQKPLRWLQAISHHRATTSGGPNFAYDLCVQKTTPEQRASLDLSPWQLAFSGAEPVRAETLARFVEAFQGAGFRETAFYPCYGMAEATLMVTGGDRGHPPLVQTLQEQPLQANQAIAATATTPPAATRQLVGCGHAPPDQGVEIVDAQTGEPCPDGVVGEIWVAASPSLAQGYWQQPEKTAATFQAHRADGAGPYLRTGDLGFLHQGSLYVTGRLKELIIIRGRNYYPKDIETTVEAAHPDLRPGAGAAFAITVGGQERLVVVQEVERQAIRTLDGEAIVPRVRQAIAEHHDLQLHGLQLIKTGAIPKTSSGKIRRYLCRAGYLDQQLAALYTWQGPVTSGADDQGGEDWVAPWSGDWPPAAPPALPSPPPLPDRPTAPEVERWLGTWLAPTLGVAPQAIDVTRPLAEYGLDSVAAVELTAALGTHLGQSLSPTLAYEYPTIAAIAAYLTQPPDTPTTPDPAGSTESAEEAELAALVDELGQLSEAELEILLGPQGR